MSWISGFQKSLASGSGHRELYVHPRTRARPSRLPVFINPAGRNGADVSRTPGRLFKRIFLFVLAMTLTATGLLAPLSVRAQQCKGDINVGCLNPGSVCSPVSSGVGTSGHCVTPGGLPPGERECNCVGAPELNLTGTWIADDGAVYYLRQIGNELWWAGFSVETPAGVNDLHKGLLFTNVFQGQISGTTVNGDWVDVPRGRNLNSGTLALSASNTEIRRQAETGGFGPAVWNRIAPPSPPDDIFGIFDQVMKNQNAWRDHSLLDNLKPAKGKPVAIFGNITRSGSDLDPMHVNYGTHDGRSYNDFICLDGNDSPPDGDIDFDIQVDRAALDAQIGFWNVGWETGHGVTAQNFRNKLDRQNKLHIESIMYGGTTECGDGGTTSLLLPGWQQAGAAGALLNGVPINGQMDMIDRDASSSRITVILGRPIEFQSRVRITGILALDCGHGLLHNCDEDDADTQNQEIHPMYALDFVQNFQLPRPFAQLTGVWSSDDSGTYYVRQIGNTVWWLGLSVDEGRTFANVFRGTVQNGQISGQWSDVPLGQTSNSGTLAFGSGAGALATAWKRISETGGFSGASWDKLYDAGNRLVVVFESAVANGALWPSTGESFEFVVGSQRVEAIPHPPRGPVTSGAAQAELGVRIAVNAPEIGPLRMAARYAGYRANWMEPNLKPGVYVQSMLAPRNLPAATRHLDKSEVTDRDAEVTGRDKPASLLPGLTIHYRVELSDTPH